MILDKTLSLSLACNLRWHNDSSRVYSRVSVTRWLSHGFKAPSTGIQYLVSGIHRVESRIQDCPGLPYMGRQGSQWKPLVRETGDIVKSASNDLTLTFIESRKFPIAFLKWNYD